MATSPRQWSSLSLEEKINAFQSRDVQSMNEQDQNIYRSLLAQQWQQKPLEEKISLFEERGIEGLSESDRRIYDSLLSQRPAESQRVRTALQGLTFGFADEIEAAIRSLGGGEGQTYEAIRDDIRNRLQAYKEQNPTEAITYETMGALAPTAVALLSGVGTGAGAANVARLTGQAGRLARTGTGVLPQAATLGGRLPRLAQGATTGAAYGGLYGVGTGEGTLGERVSEAGGEALAGAAFGAGGQALIKGVSGLSGSLTSVLSKAKTDNEVVSVMNRVKEVSDEAYNKLNKSNIGIEQNIARREFDNALQEIQDTMGYDPSLTGVSAQAQRLTQQSIDDIENIIGPRTKTIQDFVNEDIQKLRNMGVADNSILKQVNNPQSDINVSARQRFNEQQNLLLANKITLKDLNELQKRLRKRENSSYSMNQPQPAIGRLRDALENMIESSDEASPLWEQAKGFWRTRRNYEMISDELDAAIRKAEANGFGTDRVRVYKSMANSILNSKKANYLTVQEKTALRAIVSGGAVDNILQALGRFAPTASNLMRGVTLISTATSGGSTLPLSVIAAMAKSSANKRISAKAQNLLEEFLSGDQAMLDELGDIFQKADIPSPISTPAVISGRIAGPLSNTG